MSSYDNKIQDYIDGLLTGEELTAFEQRLASDEELRELLTLHREIGDIVRKRENADTEALRANLKSAEIAVRAAEDGPQSDKEKLDVPRVIRFRRYLPAVAAACAVLVLTIYYLRPVEDLYSLPTMRSEIVRGEPSEDQYEEAVVAFNTEDYAKAGTILRSLAEQDTADTQYRYYSALTAIGLEDWSAAIAGLEPIAAGTSVFADEAKYYLAISYHENGNTAEAIRVLEEITDAGETSRKAKKLLRKLR